MPIVEQTVTVACPPAVVWEFMMDPENHPVWDSGQQGTTQLTDGPTGVGTRWRGTNRVLGKKVPWTSEFTEFEPGRRSVSTSRDTQPAFTITITATEVTTIGTEVTFHMDAASGLGGLFGKLADPMVAKAYSRTIHSSLQNMADVLEASG